MNYLPSVESLKLSWELMRAFQADDSNLEFFMKNENHSLNLRTWFAKFPCSALSQLREESEYQDLYIHTPTALKSWPCLHKIKNSHESVSLSPSHFPSLLLPVCWNWFSDQKMCIWLRKSLGQDRCCRINLCMLCSTCKWPDQSDLLPEQALDLH